MTGRLPQTGLGGVVVAPDWIRTGWWTASSTGLLAGLVGLVGLVALSSLLTALSFWVWVRPEVFLLSLQRASIAWSAQHDASSLQHLWPPLSDSILRASGLARTLLKFADPSFSGCASILDCKCKQFSSFRLE